MKGGRRGEERRGEESGWEKRHGPGGKERREWLAAREWEGVVVGIGNWELPLIPGSGVEGWRGEGGEGREAEEKARKGKERGCRCLLRSEVQSVGSTSVPPHGISAGGTMRTYGTSPSLHRVKGLHLENDLYLSLSTQYQHRLYTV